MSLALLALVCVAGLVGPALAAPQRWGIPVVVGELLAGIVLGPVGAGLLAPTDHTFTFLADAGFALVMFVAGSQVPIRDPRLRRALPIGLLRAVLIAAVSAPVAIALATAFGTGHAALYAVLLASSSAALVLPTLDGLGLRHDETVLPLLPQIALADAACIVALPLATDPARAARSAVGAVAVVVCAAAAYLILRSVERRGWRRRLHRLSHRRKFAAELRVNLILLFGLAAVAQVSGVSIMLAGFAYGLAIAAVGEPRRLARQVFALTEGFAGPIFFVWLGASLDLAALTRDPRLIGLGIALGIGALLTHAVAGLTGQPLALSVLAAAQLGIPVAAATVGTRTHALSDGEPAALLLGAVLTIGAAAIAANHIARRRTATSPEAELTTRPETNS